MKEVWTEETHVRNKTRKIKIFEESQSNRPLNYIKRGIKDEDNEKIQ
jgi:hypothetical protein